MSFLVRVELRKDLVCPLQDPPVDLLALAGLGRHHWLTHLDQIRVANVVAERERMSLRTVSRRVLSTLTAVGLVAALGGAFGSVGVTPAQAATACSGSTFTADCDYTIPAGVHSLSVTVTGAAGGRWSNPTDPSPAGGNGAVVTATVAVTPGATIHVLVGGQGGEGGLSTVGGIGGNHGGGSGGDNASGTGTGGGGGGGFSALFSGTTPLVVAGGGGGAGHGDMNPGGQPSFGGDAGLSDGGARDGGCCSGGQYSAPWDSSPGLGASPSAVGIGGAGATGGGAGAGTDGATLAGGGTGSGGVGGASGTTNSADGGGGGGGGYNGGGGGGGTDNGGTGGGAGGGSSYIDPAFGTGTFATASAPAAGSVTITPGPVTPPQVPLKNCVTPPPKHGIPLLGVKQLMKAHCYTNAGQRVRVRVQGKLRNRGDLLTFSVVRKRDGRTLIKTYGNPLGLAITWSAPASGNYEAYSLVKRYKT